MDGQGETDAENIGKSENTGQLGVLGRKKFSSALLVSPGWSKS